MISLKEYIEKVDKNRYKYPEDLCHTFDNFMEVNGVTEDTVTENMIDWYVRHICDKKTYSHPAIFSEEHSMHLDDYITEMLKTTNIKLLIKELNKTLGGGKEPAAIIYTGEDYGYPKSDKDVYKVIIPKDKYDKEKIIAACEKLMWQWTSVRATNGWNRSPLDKETKPLFYDNYNGYEGDEYALIVVEPLQSELRTDFVKKDCKGILYHICNKDDVKSILRSGLRMKGEGNDYRYSKNRVYFVCAESDEKVLNGIHMVANSLGLWSSKKQSLSTKAALIKVDVSNYNIDFYKDKMYTSDVQDFVVYAFGYFPPKMLKKVNADKMFKNYEDEW